MRAAVLAALLLTAAACNREPSFDERYGATANEIEQRAFNLDQQLNEAEAGNDQST